MNHLASLQVQYQRRQESIQDLERTLVLIQDQFNNRRMLIQNTSGPVASDDEISSYQRLQNLRTRLDSLLLNYTEKHPEIIRVRKLIKKMEEEGVSGEAASSGVSQLADSVSYDKVLMQLEVQQKGIRLKIANIEKEKELLKKRIGQYEEWVKAAPQREAEWSSLTREYSQLKKHYDHLVSQNLQAESMVNLEEKQRGSQFKIEDPARYPGKPIKPDFLKIIGMSILAGLGLGLGGTLVLDIFDSSLRDPETLEPLLGIPLLITIPFIETKAEQRKRRLQFVFTLSLFLAGGVLIVTLFVRAWDNGYILV
jgi:uncharacterized protein involved in exopolysaccharide biosynthesis